MPQAAKNAVDRRYRSIARPFCNKQGRDLEIFSNRTDSRCESSRFQWSPRSLWHQRPCKSRGKAELASMLPGFRFLFAAIVLSMSVLIFGLGAAALLRAAHEQFASIPSRRPPPEPVFARQN